MDFPDLWQPCNLISTADTRHRDGQNRDRRIVVQGLLIKEGNGKFYAILYRSLDRGEVGRIPALAANKPDFPASVHAPSHS